MRERTLAVIVVVGLLLGGCVSYRASQAVTIVGGVGIVGGVVAAAVHDEPSTTSDHSLDVGGALIGLVIVTSVVVALSGVIGMGVHKPSRPPGGAQVPQAR